VETVSRPLKFLHLSIFYPPYSFGGDAMYLYRLLNALARRGHEVDIIDCADSYHVLEPRTPTASFPNHPNITVHTLKSGWGMLSPLLTQQTGGTWFKTNRIREVMLGKKFDVIHYHNTSLLGPKAVLLAPDYKDFIKLYTTHEHWLVCPMHVLWKSNERVCEKPDCFTCTLKFRRPPQWRRYTRLLEKCLAPVDAFISPSRFTRRMHHERGFTRPIEHVPYFVPLAEIAQPAAEAPPHPRPYFLFVGRLEKIKGVQNLFSVFRNYSHADLLIAGTGNYESELMQMTAGMSNVVFLGNMPQERLRALYRHAIGLLVPSICFEVFGIIILEAYMQRTPVIAYALGGVEEVVEESQGGILYRTPEELLAAMERLRTDLALRAAMGERGWRKYNERWTEEAHLEMYLRVVDETARRKFRGLPWDAPGRISLNFPPEVVRQ
jgi:glycosyltransferase involved in cell wall biosynthesis